jgi:DNA polymerase III subunit epsilon
MREIVLDTETTGLSPREGHRIVEIGCLELINHVSTGENYHQYIKPDLAMPSGAQDVHGLSDEFLSDKPPFEDIAEAFLAFVGDSPMVIHNATFDMSFINAELARINRALLPMAQTIDTVSMARAKFPGSPASLDALCRRFDIDNSARTFHGALLDAELLAEVYLELIGGRQPGLVLDAASGGKDGKATTKIVRQAREPRLHAVSEQELARHKAFLEKIKDPLWSR